MKLKYNSENTWTECPNDYVIILYYRSLARNNQFSYRIRIYNRTGGCVELSSQWFDSLAEARTAAKAKLLSLAEGF